jgi:hypothetical protein
VVRYGCPPFTHKPTTVLPHQGKASPPRRVVLHFSRRLVYRHSSTLRSIDRHAAKRGIDQSRTGADSHGYGRARHGWRRRHAGDAEALHAHDLLLGMEVGDPLHGVARRAPRHVRAGARRRLRARARPRAPGLPRAGVPPPLLAAPRRGRDDAYRPVRSPHRRGVPAHACAHVVQRRRIRRGRGRARGGVPGVQGRREGAGGGRLQGGAPAGSVLLGLVGRVVVPPMIDGGHVT